MKWPLLLFLFFSTFLTAQVQPYQLYNSKGKKISFERMTKELSKADVVLFGEFHDNSIVHWLQLKVAQELLQYKPLILGAEMFERDNAKDVMRYVRGEIDEKAFDTLVRFWNNYPTDYKPLVEFSKVHKIPFVATNVPRKYASLLYKQGEEALLQLSESEKQWIAPLPFPFDSSLPAYAKMMEMFQDQAHANSNFPKAQALKDATMGYFIAENTQKDHLFLHFNGAYHSDYFEGINWYLAHYKPEVKVVTISVVLQENVHSIASEDLRKADFVIVVDQDITKTFL